MLPKPKYKGHWMQNPITRLSWDDYFYQIAKTVASRATCPRATCGAVIVSHDNRILATGYNGAKSGKPHCIDVGCHMHNDHCVRSNHAEINALYHLPLQDSRIIKKARCYVYRKNHPGGSVGTGCCYDCEMELSMYGIKIAGCLDE